MGTARAKLRLPILQGIEPVDRKRVPMDVAAGVTLAALGIPGVMGYTSIAGMPVITGLHTILISIAVSGWCWMPSRWTTSSRLAA